MLVKKITVYARRCVVLTTIVLLFSSDSNIQIQIKFYSELQFIHTIHVFNSRKKLLYNIIRNIKLYQSRIAWGMPVPLREKGIILDTMGSR